MTKHFLCIWLLSAVLLTSGCVPLIIAGAGAVGGYAVSRDTFEGTTARGQEELTEAASRVGSIMGTIIDNDRRRGELYARIQGANVYITVVPINMTTTKLRVKARKGIFPQIGIAQEVYTKIMNQLEQ